MRNWISGGVLLCAVGAGLALMKPNVPPKAELRVVGNIVQGGVDWYELELTNHTSHDMQYLGLGPTDPRRVYLYWEGGEWKEPGGYRTGFGFGPQTLPPGGSIRFTTPRPVETPYRVGVLLRGPEYTSGNVYKLEWLPERLYAWAQDWQKERLHKRRLEAVTWTPPLNPVPYSAAEQLTLEALAEGVVMDLANLFEEDPCAAGPPVGNPFDPFAQSVGGMAPSPS